MDKLSTDLGCFIRYSDATRTEQKKITDHFVK